MFTVSLTTLGALSHADSRLVSVPGLRWGFRGVSQIRVMAAVVTEFLKTSWPHAAAQH